MTQHIYIAVTNDLVTDQRVHRTALMLHSSGAAVCLLGRKLPGSPVVGERQYRTHRFNLLFRNGFLFYAAYNLRLFLFLLVRRRISLIVANDLDTLAACFLVSKLRQARLVYDSHEYFTEVPELLGRKFVRYFWLTIEKIILPRLELASTVNASIAGIYQEKYGTGFTVIRNVPSLYHHTKLFPLPAETAGKQVVIYQGAVNTGRGIEQVIEAVSQLDNVVFIVAGTGDLFEQINEKVRRENLGQHVIMTGRLEPAYLYSLTAQADLGVSVELNAGLNYYYALPNKLFSYIHAGIPVLVSAFPEMKKIIDEWKVGMTLDNPLDTLKMREMITIMLNDGKQRAVWKKNSVIAARELCWENEQNKFKSLYNRAGITFNEHDHH